MRYGYIFDGNYRPDNIAASVPLMGAYCTGGEEYRAAKVRAIQEMMSDVDEDHGEISVLFEGDHKSYIMPTEHLLYDGRSSIIEEEMLFEM